MINGKIVTANSKNLICSWDSANLTISNPSKAQKQIVSVKVLSGTQLKGGECFYLSSPFQSYIIWYCVDNIGYIPTFGESISIRVDVSSTDTAANVALKTNSMLQKCQDFISTVSSDTLTITSSDANVISGKTEDINSNFVITVIQVGISPFIYNGQISDDVKEILDITIANDGSAAIAVRKCICRTYSFKASKKNFTKYIYILDIINKPAGWLTI